MVRTYTFSARDWLVLSKWLKDLGSERRTALPCNDINVSLVIRYNRFSYVHACSAWLLVAVQARL